MKNVTFEKNFSENAETFKVLANSVNFRILTLLQQNELTIFEIHIFIPNISKTTLSKHLTLLKKFGFLKSEKRGQHVFYKLSQEKLMSIIFNFKKIFNMEENNV
ncbi:MAG: ArsR/SmtB family transcription factor [Fusobacteriaceae bacterium]